MKKLILLGLLITVTLMLIGCTSQQPEGLPAPAGSDAAIAGQGFATGTYDRGYQLYSHIYSNGFLDSYLVENGIWNYLGNSGVGAKVSSGAFTLTVLPRREGNLRDPGSRVRLNSACSGYTIEFQRGNRMGTFWITTPAGVMDNFRVRVNTPQPVHQILGTNDAITIHNIGQSVAPTRDDVVWFTLHCDIPRSQPPATTNTIEQPNQVVPTSQPPATTNTIEQPNQVVPTSGAT